jgi:hypothetical protein
MQRRKQQLTPGFDFLSSHTAFATRVAARRYYRGYFPTRKRPFALGDMDGHAIPRATLLRQRTIEVLTAPALVDDRDYEPQHVRLGLDRL